MSARWIPEHKRYIATNYNTFAMDGSIAWDNEEEIIALNE